MAKSKSTPKKAAPDQDLPTAPVPEFIHGLTKSIDQLGHSVSYEDPDAKEWDLVKIVFTEYVRNNPHRFGAETSSTNEKMKACAKDTRDFVKAYKEAAGF